MMIGQYNLTETGRGLGFIGKPYGHTRAGSFR